MTPMLTLLGYRVRDKVTGLEGVVTCICFDLYGCIQATLNPGVDKEGKLREQAWFDVARLEVISKEPVMPPPDFAVEKGPAEKPQMWKALRPDEPR